MREALVAMVALAAAVRDAADVADTLRRLGYRTPSHVIENLLPVPAVALGDPDNVRMRTDAWRFRCALEARKII
jgi:hypothetical protein